MNMKFRERINFFLEQLSSRPKLGGLHITDSAILYVEPGGKAKTAGVRLQPGVVQEGRVLNAQALLAAFVQLHAAIEPEEKRVVPVSVVLPAHGVYTQSFSVPNVGRERLEESAQLNLQMISPMATDVSYASWQVMQETQDQFEILGAFAERAFVDSFRTLLEQAHFSAVAMEFPSLALARLLVLAGNADMHPSLLLQVTGEGINLSILRGRGLSFDYFRSWRSVQGEERTITQERFEQVVGEELQKVINFTISKFKESPQRVFIVAPGFEAAVQGFVQARFGLASVLLQVPSLNLSPQWYVAAGAAMREQEGGAADRTINLAPAGSGAFFYREQALNFIVLWRGIAGAVLVSFLVFFAGGAYVLATERASTQDDLSIFSANIPTKELNQLTAQVAYFNKFVGMIRTVRGAQTPWPAFFARLRDITDAHKVTIERIETATMKDPVALTAFVSGYDGVTEFRKALSAEKEFSAVNLSVADITQREDGSVEFRISFVYTPPTTKN